MRNAVLKTREIEPDVYLPFGRHITDTVIGLTTRALLTVIRIDGASFETAEISDVNDLHGKLNLTLRNIADPRLALWTHLVRRRTSIYPDGAFRSTFAAELDAQYRDRLRKEALFCNDLYLTLVCHPGRAATDTAAAFFRRLGRSAGHSVEVDSEALKGLTMQREISSRPSTATAPARSDWLSATASPSQIRWSGSTRSPPESGCRCRCRKGRSALRSIQTVSSSAAKPSRSAAPAGRGSLGCSDSRNIQRPPGLAC